MANNYSFIQGCTLRTRFILFPWYKILYFFPTYFYLTKQGRKWRNIERTKIFGPTTHILVIFPPPPEQGIPYRIYPICSVVIEILRYINTDILLLQYYFFLFFRDDDGWETMQKIKQDLRAAKQKIASLEEEIACLETQTK